MSNMSDPKSQVKDPASRREGAAVLRRTLLAIAAVLMAAMGTVGAVAAVPDEADAAGRNVRVQGRIGNWNCIHGGSVKYNAVTFVPGASPSHPRGQNNEYTGWYDVPSRQRITVAGRALCSRSWWRGGPYWVNIIAHRWFWPDQNWRTTWI